MKLPIPNERERALFDVLKYCSLQQSLGRTACFTTLERICINQERGALLSQVNSENTEQDKRYYQCPAPLESKIKFIIQKVIDINLITK